MAKLGEITKTWECKLRGELKEKVIVKGMATFPERNLTTDLVTLWKSSLLMKKEGW